MRLLPSVLTAAECFIAVDGTVHPEQHYCIYCFTDYDTAQG